MAKTIWGEIAPFFARGEFRYPDRMDEDFLRWLHRLRTRAGVPFRITSDHRPSSHNAAVGGVTNSAHTEDPCSAVDLEVRSSRERFLVLREAFAGDCPDTLREILARVTLPEDLRTRAERALGDLVRRVGIYPPTASQRARYGVNAGTIHLDRSTRLPQDVAWVSV
ncbi:MAG TPA: D-Ala-D-Ala carboxypeptidase family metallohydrolase [Longimicrobiales bacterium]|nr:D-Ala-D-Ala carboxypeptidase family metallohydrolase [Longimicrobiales bacterium]